MRERVTKITLLPPEISLMTTLLNVRLRGCTSDTNFIGERKFGQLQQAEASPLNTIYRQLTGHDHREYAIAYGHTGLPVRRASSKLRLSNDSKHALLTEIGNEILWHPRLERTYKETLNRIASQLE